MFAGDTFQLSRIYKRRPMAALTFCAQI